jgi:hypothetical protein
LKEENKVEFYVKNDYERRRSENGEEGKKMREIVKGKMDNGIYEMSEIVNEKVM